MHPTLSAIAIGVLFVAPNAPARAQTIVALTDYDTARAGLRVGCGGHGLDLQASVDSRRFASLIRGPLSWPPYRQTCRRESPDALKHR